MSSILLLSSNSTLPFLHNRRFLSAPFKPCSKSQICFSISPPNNNQSGYGPQEEVRWLREEQRWLREEQRWLREEQRWKEERLGFIQEISRLNIRLQELEQLSSLPAASVENVAQLIRLLMEGDLGQNTNRIIESESSDVPLIVDTAIKSEEVGVKDTAIKSEEVVVKEVITVPDRKAISKRTLRSGSEGDDVRSMQEALQKLGFYSGEEDIEFSSFSTGTERAVKTWQATIGVPEDGIMSAKLLEQLYMERKFGSSGPEVAKNRENKATGPKSENGAPIASITDTSEEGATDVSITQHRVFLLGENRWEEPSRLYGNNKGAVPPKTATKCLSCRGEGRVLCMECDGTGEPNVEPQFLEWLDEGAKCPYCEGLGYTTCDVCGGETVVDA